MATAGIPSLDTTQEDFQRPPSVLLSYVLGEKIVVKRILPATLILIENLEPDVLFETESGQLIHAELHGYGMTKFAARNLIYCGMVIRDYDRKPVALPRLDTPGGLRRRDGGTLRIKVAWLQPRGTLVARTPLPGLYRVPLPVAFPQFYIGRDVVHHFPELIES